MLDYKKVKLQQISDMLRISSGGLSVILHEYKDRNRKGKPCHKLRWLQWQNCCELLFELLTKTLNSLNLSPKYKALQMSRNYFRRKQLGQILT